MISSVNIYKAIKEVLPIRSAIKYGYVDISKVEKEYTIIATDTLAIYIRPADEAIRTLGGEYEVETVRVNFNLFTHKGEDGVLWGDAYCKDICDALDATYNKKILKEDFDILLMQFKRLGRYNYVGLNEQGVAVYSINYLLQFSGKQKE